MSDYLNARFLVREEDMRASPTPLVVLRSVWNGFYCFEAVKCFTMDEAERVFDERGAIGIYHNGEWVRRKMEGDHR